MLIFLYYICDNGGSTYISKVYGVMMLIDSWQVSGLIEAITQKMDPYSTAYLVYGETQKSQTQSKGY